jgi:hypothetical protein
MRLVVLGACVAVGVMTAACGHMDVSTDSSNDTPVIAEKPFASGGRIEMHLSGGSYDVRTGGDRIRVQTSGHTGDTKVDVSADNGVAAVNVSNTPNNNFRAAIDVPKTADVVIHLTAGEITVAPVAGNLDVDSMAGNVTIDVTNPDDYASFAGEVKAGDLKAEAFNLSKSGLMQSVTWTGPGKYKLHASLGAGNLTIRR